MGKPKNYCELCHVKNKAWSEERFFGIASCKNHPKQSLIILAEHRAKLTEDEEKEMEKLAQKYWPGSKERGYMGSLKTHWHDHRILNK